jgi:hypothetical protein
MNPSDIMKFAQKGKALDKVMEENGNGVRKPSKVQSESYKQNPYAMMGNTTTASYQNEEIGYPDYNSLPPTSYSKPLTNNLLNENREDLVKSKLGNLPESLQKRFATEGFETEKMQNYMGGSILEQEIINEAYPIPQQQYQQQVIPQSNFGIDPNMIKDLIKEVLLENGVINNKPKNENPIVISMNDKEIKILIGDEIFGGNIKHLGKKKTK